MTDIIARVLDFLSTGNIIDLASNKWVLAGVGAVVILSVIFRWKWVLGLLLISGISLAILRYTQFRPVEGEVDPSLLIFVGGSLLIGGVLIYLFFISSD
ncbi:MAG: hypothetical protein D6713_00260 [Deltaproteobacteria bacterium]|nr:MAG: hypothetical protein D6713_00260 [Deltaproteobacteria bacterium]